MIIFIIGSFQHGIAYGAVLYPGNDEIKYPST